jgi:hypothetical protein
MQNHAIWSMKGHLSIDERSQEVNRQQIRVSFASP